MKAKRLFVIAAMPIAVAVTLGVLAMLQPRPVAMADFDRINAGMPKAEVEAILGKPHMDSDPERSLGINWRWQHRPKNNSVQVWKIWKISDGSEGHICFDDDVSGCVFCDPPRPTENFLGKLRLWLHLP